MPRVKSKTFFWIGLSIIAVLYCLYYLFFMYGVFIGMPLRARHIIKFLFILMAYAAGAYFLKKYALASIFHTWHVLFLTTLCRPLLLWIYHLVFAPPPFPITRIPHYPPPIPLYPLL